MNKPLTTDRDWRQHAPRYYKQHLWCVVEREYGVRQSKPTFPGTSSVQTSRENRHVARRYAALYSQQNPGKIYDVALYISSWAVAKSQLPLAIDRSYLNGKRLEEDNV